MVAQARAQLPPQLALLARQHLSPCVRPLGPQLGEPARMLVPVGVLAQAGQHLCKVHLRRAAARLRRVAAQVALNKVGHHVGARHNVVRVVVGVEAERRGQCVHHLEQPAHWQPPGGERVELAPRLEEMLLILDLQHLDVAPQRNHVVLKDDGDEHLEHNEGGEYHEGDEVGDGQPAAARAAVWVARFSIGCQLGLVVHQVMHDGDPSLAGGAVEEGEHSRGKDAEAQLVADEHAVAHGAEELHAQQRVHGEQDEEERDDVDERRQREHQHREQHLQSPCRLEDPKRAQQTGDARNAQDANERGVAAKFGGKFGGEFIGHREEHDRKVKHMPRLANVLAKVEGADLDGGL